MKKIFLGLIMMIGVTAISKAQVGMSNLPPTHIQSSPPNATFQNNSQFYNKDNHSIGTRQGASMTSNGTYWTPGYSNESNRQPYTDGLAPTMSVNGSMNTSANSFYNSTINYSSPTSGSTNTNRATPSSINSNVITTGGYRP
ncbi:MAG: hypothetical protein EOP56_15515 [Sphingobacteriales bacterium]|nr:MAG: hypothetical protein EOP56_15515 [Sphingobacteriales bacterium]